MITLWLALLAIITLLYVLFDGFDLGVGVLFGLTRDARQRDDMLRAIAPVWDGNETWLVAAGVVLWGAFPSAYAALLSAFYLPITAMLAGLILRGVAFEFQHNAIRTRPLWDASFFLGSTVAAFMQGVMVGGLVVGLPTVGGFYSGHGLEWMSPFALFCGFGLAAGYSLLGACWLVLKCVDATRAAALRWVPWLSAALLALLVIVSCYALFVHQDVARRWFDTPVFFLLRATGAMAAVLLAIGVRRGNDAVPLAAAMALFVVSFLALGVSFWPYVVPFSIKTQDAAAPMESLRFMFWGAGLFIFPLMLGYTFFSYRVFQGKTLPSD